LLLLSLFGVDTTVLRGPQVSQLQAAAATDGATRAKMCASLRAKGIFADGFSRTGCETDISPKSTRKYFKDLVCGTFPTCRMKQRKMTPELCFEFCREYAVSFFALQGDDCYCTPWHKGGAQGTGTCNFACAGNGNEKCGSADKMSIFEQHLCGDSANEAEAALQLAEDAKTEANATLQQLRTVRDTLADMSTNWTLGICSLSKQNVCDLKGKFLDGSHNLNKLVSDISHEYTDMERIEVTMRNLSSTIAAGNASGSDYSRMEEQTKHIQSQATHIASLRGKSDIEFTVAAGPLLKEKPLEKFATLFEPVVNMSMKGTHAICDLKVLQMFHGAAANDPSICANHCLGKSECVAFNYQHKDGVTACQTLSREGLVKPVILFSVPAFEITDSMVADLHFSRIDCFVKSVFMKDNGRGRTKIAVLKQIVREPSGAF